MMKPILKSFLPIIVFSCSGLFAQTRVFKEVGGEIKTQVNIIRQDNQLVGYIAFTQLEKATADSFNYRLTIMDENLNDIGVVNFRELSLKLQGISFESDIICLAYTRSPLSLLNPNMKKEDYEYEKQKKKKDIGVFFQFLTLDGKISKTTMIPEEIISFTTISKRKGNANVNLKKGLQIQNVKEKGFVVYYGGGHQKINSLLFVKTDGTKIWQKKLPNFDNFLLQVASTGIHLLAQPISKVVLGGDPDTEESNEILSYALETGESLKTIKLRDPKQNDLRLLSFRTNPETGRLNALGLIVNPEKDYYPLSYKQHTKQPYIGLFNIDFAGVEKNEIKYNFSMFNSADKGQIFNEKFRLAGEKSYLAFNNAFLDGQGNAYFSASKIEKKPRIGSIISSVLTIPLYLPPIVLACFGYNGYREIDGQVVIQKADGTLVLQTPIQSERSRKAHGKEIFIQTKDFQYAKGLSGENFYLFSDPKQLSIYQVKQDKVVRTIPLKEGKESLNIYPAKEGYFMVQEYNSKEKSTSLSIEAL